jgi:hypothetical protein
MRRPLLLSCALHAVVVLMISRPAPRPPARASASAVEIALAPVPPPSLAVAVDVAVPSHDGGGGPAHPEQPAAVAPARAHHRRVAAASPATPEPPPVAPAPPLATPPASDEGQVAVAEPAPAPGTPAAAPDEQGTGVGDGAGDGLGDGVGDGFGPGSGGPAMSRELHARVLGDEVVDVRPREGSPIISHDEATALRTRDRFPRLPESVWSDWRPYIVKLEICVGEDGRVREAALRSSASTRLDPLVLAAARTWLYRPRVVDGKPAPFCHGVVIKYERW